MTDEDRKRESERVRSIQKQQGPHRWVYDPTPAKLEAARERVRRWRAAHPEYDRERAHRRRAQQADSDVSREWLTVLALDPCCYCGGPGGTVDHIDPISGIGRHEVENLTAACASCNSRKGVRRLLSFLSV